jgi:hypothetical protein
MMLRTASTCLLAFFAVPFLFAIDPPKPDTAKTESKAARWDALQNQLKDIRQDITELRKRCDIDEKARTLEMDFIKERLDKLDRSLESLRGTTRRSSEFEPGTPAASGTIRLENRSAVPASVVLAGRSYSLAPGQIMVLAAQPVGTFVYSVLADGFGEIRAPVTRTLRSGETFTIAINP